jgi:hypothetical protein
MLLAVRLDTERFVRHVAGRGSPIGRDCELIGSTDRLPSLFKEVGMARRGLVRSLLALPLVISVLLLGAPPAQAATSWSRSTTGASGSGTYSRPAQTYYLTYRITDTKADGSCAYVVFRPQVYYEYTGTWLSVGYSGYQVRYDVCGNGNVRSGGVYIDVWAVMSPVDHTAGSKIRMYIRVCRNVNNASDNCSGMTTPPVDL